MTCRITLGILTYSQKLFTSNNFMFLNFHENIMMMDKLMFSSTIKQKSLSFFYNSKIVPKSALDTIITLFKGIKTPEGYKPYCRLSNLMPTGKTHSISFYCILCTRLPKGWCQHYKKMLVKNLCGIINIK